MSIYKFCDETGRGYYKAICDNCEYTQDEPWRYFLYPPKCPKCDQPMRPMWAHEVVNLNRDGKKDE